MNCLDALDLTHHVKQGMNEPMWDKLLPEPLPEPYRRAYTLVINLDETLVYSTWDVSSSIGYMGITRY